MYHIEISNLQSGPGPCWDTQDAPVVGCYTEPDGQPCNVTRNLWLSFSPVILMFELSIIAISPCI